MPRAGDPDSGALSVARLAHYGCADRTPSERARIKAQIRQMNREVDRSLSEYLARPVCRSPNGFGIGAMSLGEIGHGSGGYSARTASGTNNQVFGVDEADIVKHDGAYLYLAQHGSLRIVEAMTPRLVSVTPVDGEARRLLLDRDRAVVLVSIGGKPREECTYAYDCAYAGDKTRTRLLVFDISDRAHPKVVRTLELSGSLVAARRIGSTIHTVVVDNDRDTHPYETWPANVEEEGCRSADAANGLAEFSRLRVINARKIRQAKPPYPELRDGDARRDLCEILTSPTTDDGRAYTTIVSFDLHADAVAPTTATIQSRPGAVFASADALYLTTVHDRDRASRSHYFYDGEREVSDIRKFRIGASPDRTAYVGSGVVPGHVLNQFSMDEWYGYLRIATSRGRAADANVENAVSVLAEASDGNLVRIGAVLHLAPHEDIRAVRFDDDRGYVVTFKKTDPLFVLDLARPDRPYVLGELEIPGFSTYLHRIDPTHLLSIGLDADDHGAFAYFGGLLLQMFDVTRPTEPRLLYRETIGTRGSSSLAVTNHLAFNYFGERQLLSIPATICGGGGDGKFGHSLEFSGLLIYSVSPKDGFVRRGGVDHGEKHADCKTWWSQAKSVVQRSIFMDDLVFSIAGDRMKVQRLSALGKDVADIALEP